jgi:mannose-6-phosphate isomerase-like protein (cupin superfamily)
MERYRLIRSGEGTAGRHPGDVPVGVRVLVGADLTPNVRVKLTSTPVGVAKGGGHRHERCEHVAYIVSGQARIRLDDDPPFLLRPGDTLYVAAGVFHDVEPVGDAPLVTLMVDVPPED